MFIVYDESVERNFPSMTAISRIPLADQEWRLAATQLLKGEMHRQRVSFKELARRLERFGVKLGNAQLSNKVRRGTFALSFYLQCMRALDVSVVRLFDDELSELQGKKKP